MMNMDDGNEYAGLTDDEIAELKAAEADTPEPDEELDEAEAAAKAEADAKAAAEAEAAKAAETETAEPAAEVAPPLRAKAPANVDEALAAISTDEESLTSRFDDGDITAKEFRDGINAIADRREAIRWEQRKAELASEMEKQAVENAQTSAWNRTVGDFMYSTGANIVAAGEEALKGFDKFVRFVTADPANAKLSDRAQLEKSYKLFMASDADQFGIKPAAKQEGQQPTQQQPKKVREIPPTLARVPAAEVEITDGGKYAALDRMASSDPEGYERAVAKLSPREADEYANFAG